MFDYCPQCKEQIRLTESRYECQKCGFCLHINAAAAVGVIIYNNQGEVLLTRRAREPKKGFWELPGGFVDIGETAEAAVKREVREELGLELAASEYVCSHPNEYFYRGIMYYPLDLFFTAPAPKDEVRIDKDEIEEWRFFAWEEMPWQELAFKSYEPALRLWQQARKIRPGEETDR